MPIEMIKEFIGKKVSISIDGGIGSMQAVIIAVEDNWIKVEDKRTVRILNCDMISQISLAKEQNKEKL